MNKLRLCLCLLVFGVMICMAENVAVVVKCKGGVQSQKPGSTDWKNTIAGEVLASGTRLKTENDGLLMLKFIADGSMVRMKPGSVLTIYGNNGDVTDAKKTTTVSMGSVFFNIQKQPAGQHMQIATPTSVASIKGTTLWITIGTDSSTTLVCAEGLIGLMHLTNGKSVEVAAGYTGQSDAKNISVRKTQPNDYPAGERTQTMDIQFRDKDNTIKTLKIEYDGLK